MAIQIGGNDVINNSRKGIFQSANIGAYANPARPTGASTGDIIYSTTDSQLQVWNGSAWVAAGSAGKEIPSSGGNTVVIGDEYVCRIFTSPGTFTLGAAADIDYFIVAGGGSGGSGGYAAAGGGAGGVLMGSLVPYAAGPYPVTVGAGAATSPARGNQGSNSTFGPLTATGGGGGGASLPSPVFQGGPGGSAGGNGSTAGTAGQGNPGVGGGWPTVGGGGGGAGSVGTQTFLADFQPGAGSFTTTRASSGGIGVMCNIPGVPSSFGEAAFGQTNSHFFAAGGGGANTAGFNPIGMPGPKRNGSIGGGGYGASPAGAAQAGFTNTGGGGGGGNTLARTGAGGSGIVIIGHARYQA